MCYSLLQCDKKVTYKQTQSHYIHPKHAMKKTTGNIVKNIICIYKTSMQSEIICTATLLQYMPVSGLCKSSGTLCGVCVDLHVYILRVLSPLWLWRADVNVIVLTLLIFCKAVQGHASVGLSVVAAPLKRGLWGRPRPWEGREMSAVNAPAGSAHRRAPASVRVTEDPALAGASPQTWGNTLR